MAALILYLLTAGAILYAWHRRVQPLSWSADIPVCAADRRRQECLRSTVIALVLLLLPTLFTGRAIFTGRVYDASDYGYLYRPLNDYANELGVQVR